MEFIKPKRTIKKVYIHCSASDVPAHDNIETIRKWHLERGFNDVGYHYFITKNGTIEHGRPIQEIPAAQKGNNTGSIAICLSGLNKPKFTQDQFKSLNKLCHQINNAYNRKITFHGHCEVSDKECPVFDYKQVLDLDDECYILSKTWNNVLSTSKTEKKMSFTLLTLAAPLIKKLAIKGFDKLKDTAKETIVQKFIEKTGFKISNSWNADQRQDEFDKSINSLSPEKLLELKKEIIESETELKIAEAENQTKQLAIVNKTMRDEIKSDDLWQRTWRPFNGFAFAITMFITLTGYTLLGGMSIYYKSPEILKMLSELIFATSPLIIGWSAVLGVSSYTRGKEKLKRLR